METTTITLEKQTSDETLLLLIQDFFDCRKLPEHLVFLDYWMKKVLINQPHKKFLNASDLLFFSNKFLKLLNICHSLATENSDTLVYFKESVKIPQHFIAREREVLKYYPNYLRDKEICDPLLVFQSIFKSHGIDFYQETIQHWINEGLSSHYEAENAKFVFPTYSSLKKMIEACWLIHERSISKNSYQSLYENRLNPDFSLSCPLLLSDEFTSDPYLMIESFFSFASINEYREDLTQWFKAALNEQHRYENANDLLFIHNQFTQLIQAGFLIGTHQIAYLPNTNYSKQYSTFGHWLLARMDEGALSTNPIQNLSPHFREHPILYLNEFLTINDVIKLRHGLKEWLEAALSQNYSIASLDPIYIFDQFEELQKILEALFLLIIEPSQPNNLTFTSQIN